MRNQKIPAQQESQQGPPGDRKHVVPAQSAPDDGEPLDAVERRIARIERTVQCADAGADHHVGANAVRGKRMQHADLNGAKTAAAGEHEGGFGPTGIVGYGQGVFTLPDRRVDESRAPLREVIAGGWNAALPLAFPGRSAARCACGVGRCRAGVHNCNEMGPGSAEQRRVTLHRVRDTRLSARRTPSQ
jgi:hypothetical protein